MEIFLLKEHSKQIKTASKRYSKVTGPVGATMFPGEPDSVRREYHSCLAADLVEDFGGDE